MNRIEGEVSMAIIAGVHNGELDYEYSDNSKKNGLNPMGSKLGYDQFLQLLCAEMQHQDPLEPTSNTDYVAQMATFSQLEATLTMNQTQQSDMANSLVGKQVILKVTSETTGEVSYVDGKVDYIMYQGGEAMLSVNDNLYPLSSLDTVADTEYYEAVGLAKTFVDMIQALPEQENINLSYKKGIEQLREIYDGMTDYQKSFVPDEVVGTLKEYEEYISKLQEQEEDTNGGPNEKPEENSDEKDKIETV